MNFLNFLVSTLLPIAASVIVIAAILLALRKKKAQPPPVSAETNELLRESRQKISRLGFFANRFEDEAVAERIRKISRTAAEILMLLGRKPAMVSDVRFFLSYYLPVLTKLIEDYDALGGKGVSEGAVAETKRNLEALIADVDAAFQKQLDAMASDSIIDIDAEIKVFSRSLREDGLIDGGADLSEGLGADGREGEREKESVGVGGREGAAEADGREGEAGEESRGREREAARHE
ncbi:MAG: 5-bromo-4-chloroindolyl phosphate hydrolysis family protein [Clostridiales bacterium]|nr:5-bromo-4-chloroindolyl phosphate hydrolysis family protein [Clostridiales bacterium]